MTLLSACQDAAARLGLSALSAIVSVTNDPNASTLLALAKQEARELSERHNWTILLREHTWTSAATETQAGGLPSDFARFIDETFWNRTARRPVYGPLTEAEWQTLKAQGTLALPDRFRLRGGSMLLAPVPTAGWTYAYEYISADRWGTDKEDPTVDTDACVLSEALLADGLVWRWKQSKGFDYAEDFTTYQRNVANAIHRDGGRRRLTFGRERAPGTRGVSVPEGNWSL